MIVRRLPKRILEAVSKRYFLDLVADVYSSKGTSRRSIIRRNAEIWYGMHPKGFINRTISRVFIDFVYQAQLELFKSELLVDLGPSPIGFDNLVIHCSSGDANSSVVYLYGFCDNLTYFDIYTTYALPGSIALDIGANLGIHSLVLSKCVGEEGAVFAYEPIETIYNRLTDNIALNRIDNIIARSVGIGDDHGEIGFDDQAGEFNIGKGRVDKNKSQTIQITSIDREVEGMDLPVSLIKIDVEGFELHVIKGAKETLRRYRPSVLCEFNPHAFSFGDLTNEIPYEAQYFKVPYTYWDKLRPIDNFHFKEPADILIIPSDNDES